MKLAPQTRRLRCIFIRCGRTSVDLPDISKHESSRERDRNYTRYVVFSLIVRGKFDGGKAEVEGFAPVA